MSCKQLAELYELLETKNEMNKFIEWNFVQVAPSEEWTSVSSDVFCNFLMEDQLEAQSELDVFK